MSHQNITAEEHFQKEGIWVPFDLAEFQIERQQWQEDGCIHVEVRAKTTQATCPTCHKVSRKVHDTRRREKRDIPLRGYQIRISVKKRRFRCFSCQKTFTERDHACGWRRRTTARLRDDLASQAQKRPIAHIAQEAGVGPRFIQECFEQSMEERMAKQGRTLEETASLPTPRFLGIDEFARRKGHVYETILCDLEHRTVLEVSEGRTLEEVKRLLERLNNPERVEAVSMDMSASFRPAVQLCLPKAHIVVDHFHVIQHVMKAFKKIVSSWAHKKEGKPLLQGKQYLFLGSGSHKNAGPF